MDYSTTIEMEAQWNISAYRIAKLCEEGWIEGVLKKGKTWLISVDSQKTEDLRKKRGK